MSRSVQPSPLLRFALIGDALASGATGLILALGGGHLAGWFGLPEQLLRFSGLFFLAYAAAVAYVGTRPAVSQGAVWGIIAANAAWAVKSVLFLLSGWAAPTAIGAGFVVLQALVVAAFAEIQFIGLRKVRTAPLAQA
jgi:hypothetical protein